VTDAEERVMVIYAVLGRSVAAAGRWGMHLAKVGKSELGDLPSSSSSAGMLVANLIGPANASILRHC
jgi:hypothetical protein